MNRARTAVAGVTLALLTASNAAVAQAPRLAASEYRADANSFAQLVNARYAYLERIGGRYALTPALQTQADAVHDEASLLAFLQHALALLADHHAITGRSLADDWATVPSFSDIWVEEQDGGWRVSSVRSASVAAASVRTGDLVIDVGGTAMAQAVADFWRDLGLSAPDAAHRAYAARVLIAGRRNREREFTLERNGLRLPMRLPSLYAARQDKRPLVSLTSDGGKWRIRLHDSLGEDATIAAFDATMTAIPSDAPVVLDLTDTPSGGNSVIARAIMGWFVDRPRPYQAHASPQEERRTGVPRMWAEYVLPRQGMHHSGRVTVLVDRWTGRMGEGLAVGLDALGFAVCGGPMAGLLGAVDDIRLERSGLVVKFATERLMTVGAVAREQFQPLALHDSASAAIDASH